MAALVAVVAPMSASAQTADFSTLLKLTTDLGYSVKTTPENTTSFVVRFPSKVGELPVRVVARDSSFSIFVTISSITHDAATLKKALDMNRTGMRRGYLQLGEDGKLEFAMVLLARGLDSALLKDAYAETVRSVEASGPVWQKQAQSQPAPQPTTAPATASTSPKTLTTAQVKSTLEGMGYKVSMWSAKSPILYFDVVQGTGTIRVKADTSKPTRVELIYSSENWDTDSPRVKQFKANPPSNSKYELRDGGMHAEAVIVVPADAFSVARFETALVDLGSAAQQIKAMNFPKYVQPYSYNTGEPDALWRNIAVILFGLIGAGVALVMWRRKPA
jgi:hypothetical protein